VRHWITPFLLILLALNTVHAAEIAIDEAEFRLAERLYNAGRYTESAAEAAEFTAKRPGSAFVVKAYLLAGKANAASGDFTKAEAAYRQVMMIAPASAEKRQAHFALGDTLLKLGRHSDAAVTLADFAKLYPDSPACPGAYKLSVREYLASGDIQKAEAAYRQLSLKFPASPQTAEAQRLLGNPALPSSSVATVSSSSVYNSSTTASSAATIDVPVRETDRTSGKVVKNSLPVEHGFFSRDAGESRGGQLRANRGVSSSDQTVLDEPDGGLHGNADFRRDEPIIPSRAVSSEASSEREGVVYKQVEVPVYVTNEVVQPVFETNLATNFSTNWVILTNSWEVTNIYFATNLLQNVISNMSYLTNTIYEKVMLTNTVSNEFIETNVRNVVLSNQMLLTNFLTNRYLMTNFISRELISTNRIVVSNGIMITQMVSVLDTNAVLVEEEKREAERQSEEMERYQSLLELRAKLLDLKQQAIDRKRDMITDGSEEAK
jgi:tetratricopeptide (TPR) repeat protein